MSDNRSLRVISSLAEARDRYRPERPSGDGGGRDGGGPRDPMEARVAELEAGQKAILAKLDEIGKSITDGRLDNEKRFGGIEGRLTGIEAKLDARATKADLTPIETKLTKVQDAVDTRAATSDLNLLKGKVDVLPTTTQLVLFAIAIFTAAGITRWIG